VIKVTQFDDFGHQDHGWLKACHHFSFADYYDPKRMGFGPLRVWNDDHIAAGAGFPTHPHSDMEIITYVRRGAVSHEDSLGNRGHTLAGQVQVMSAGHGIRHSEFNLGPEDLDLFQIWLEPNERGLEPRWETRTFAGNVVGSGLVTLVSGRFGAPDDALMIHQDAAFKVAMMGQGEIIEVAIEPGRHAYVVPARGAIEVDGCQVSERGAAEVSGQTALTIKALDSAEVVLFDLP